MRKVLLLAVCVLAGCAPQKEVERGEVPVLTTQAHRVERVSVEHCRDTVVRRDSVFHYVKGDTVLIERWHYLQNTARAVRVDTVVKTDSIEVPVTMTRTIAREVARPLAWWQKALMAMGGCSVIGVFLLIAHKTGRR